jgi:polyisoprenoid-binding protein YceI
LGWSIQAEEAGFDCAPIPDTVAVTATSRQQLAGVGYGAVIFSGKCKRYRCVQCEQLIKPGDTRRHAPWRLRSHNVRGTDMPFSTLKPVMIRHAVCAALLVAAPIAMAAQKDRHPPEDATAAAQYTSLHVSTNPKLVVAGEYTLDPHHTSVIAKLSHMGLSRYTLRFDTVSGRYAFNPDHAAATDLEIAIDPASIDTGDQAFDKRIASKFLQTDKYPSITFTAAKARIVGDHVRLEGMLDFHGVQKPIVLNVTYRGFAQSRMGFSGEATFKRSAFGVAEWIPLEADEVTILVETEFVKK